jgi:hypothetical protein
VRRLRFSGPTASAAAAALLGHDGYRRNETDEKYKLLHGLFLHQCKPKRDFRPDDTTSGPLNAKKEGCLDVGDQTNREIVAVT